MSSTYRFDGRVAVVTGAGRGIGRAYARLLAERGARVVVNDLGGTADGSGADDHPARRTADEINAAGGTAVADLHDVSTPEGGQAIVDAALEHFGRIDIVINNAGTVRYAAFPDITLDNLQHHIAVHLYGAFNTTQAAWPHFARQGYGRIVLTGSAGMFGMDNNLSYAAAKAAMIGFANSAALTGAAHGIKINTIAPNALTRLGGADESAPEAETPVPGQIFLPSALVAPLAAYL
ncbi:MAG: SDR family NAD(P)-dependent oxidoreductase, partial [Comamonas sp.]